MPMVGDAEVGAGQQVLARACMSGAQAHPVSAPACATERSGTVGGGIVGAQCAGDVPGVGGVVVGGSQPVLAAADMGGAQSHTSGVAAASADVGDADIDAFLADVLRGEDDDTKRTLVVSLPPHLLDEHGLQADEERALFVRCLLDGAVPMDRVTAVTVRTRPARRVEAWRDSGVGPFAVPFLYVTLSAAEDAVAAMAVFAERLPPLPGFAEFRWEGLRWRGDTWETPDMPAGHMCVNTRVAMPGSEQELLDPLNERWRGSSWTSPCLCGVWWCAIRALPWIAPAWWGASARCSCAWSRRG